MENFGHFLFQHLVTLSRQIFRSKQSYFWTADRRFSWEKYLFLDILKQTDHRQWMWHSCWADFFHNFIWFILSDTTICLLNLSVELWKQKIESKMFHRYMSFDQKFWRFLIFAPAFVCHFLACRERRWVSPPTFLFASNSPARGETKQSSLNSKSPITQARRLSCRKCNRKVGGFELGLIEYSGKHVDH